MFQELKNNPLLFAFMLLVCFLVSTGVRYQQFETWKKNPAAFFVGDRPMMTTLDAPYWLRMAREYNEGTLYQKDHLRTFPDSTSTIKEVSIKKLSIPLKYTDPNLTSFSSSGTPKIKYHDVPLLSFLIAHIAPFFNYNYYLTGTLLVPVLSSLFILPLGIFFLKIGLPVSGLLGGLIGTFASGYYMRSSIGRIDTDMLNLFFPLLAALLILLASRGKTKRSVLLYSAGAGLSLFLFYWWYSRAGFTLVYFAVLVFILFIQRICLRTILLSAFLFVLFTHPWFFLRGMDGMSVLDFLGTYLTIGEAASGIVTENVSASAIFPNTMTTISEVDHVPMIEVFRRVLSNHLFDWAGVIGFCGLVVFRWRVLLPLLPMLALGLLSFQSSNRFIMYLAPFIGIGLGFIINLGIEVLFYFLPWKRVEGMGKNKKKGSVEKRHGSGSLWDSLFNYAMEDEEDKESNGIAAKITNNAKGEDFQSFKVSKFQNIDWWNWTRQGVLYFGMGLFFWGISSQTAIFFVPGPSIHPRLYATFLEVKNRVPKDSAILTWWDYGYAITDATGLATFHDGGGQKSPKTYFIARGLISQDADELHDITLYLATAGNRGIIENNTSPKALLQAVRNPEQKPWNPIYLFFTADMTGKYGAISKLGSWDIEKGGSQPRGYRNLTCTKFTNEKMNCRGAIIDLKAGIINNQIALRRIVFIREGQVIKEQEFAHTQGFSLQLLLVGRQIVEVQLIDEEVFRSNYNQMFLLGRYRKDLFDETYNVFPFSRLYLVKY